MRGPWLVMVMMLALPRPAPALELAPVEAVFGPDEDIEVVAYNETTKLVIFGSSVPFVARNLDTGYVAQFVGLAIVIDLLPGERMSFGIPGGELEPGNWSLEFRYWEGDYVRRVQSVDFRIATAQGAPADALPVTVLKCRYGSD